VGKIYKVFYPVTGKKNSLTPEHLAAVGAENIPICIAGIDDLKEFCDVFTLTHKVCQAGVRKKFEGIMSG